MYGHAVMKSYKSTITLLLGHVHIVIAAREDPPFACTCDIKVCKLASAVLYDTIEVMRFCLLRLLSIHREPEVKRSVYLQNYVKKTGEHSHAPATMNMSIFHVFPHINKENLQLLWRPAQGLGKQ